MHELVIEGKIVNTDKIFDAQIGISDSKIKEIRKQGLRGEKKITVKNGLVFPGFIDPHTHMREDGSHEWDYKEDFESGSKAAAHGGVTTAIDMPNNFQPTVTKDRLLEKIKLSEKSIIEMLFHGGVDKNHLEEISKMAKYLAGYKVYLAETTGGLFLERDHLQAVMEEISKINMPAVFHVEDIGLLDEVISQTKKLNMKSHIAHVSRKSILDLLKNSKLTYEVTPHHILFDRNSKDEMKLLGVKPPIGDSKDRNALLNALKNEDVSILATDHAPHSIKDKEGGANGVPSLDVYGNIVAWLLQELKLDPLYVAKITSLNAAKIFNIKHGVEIKENNMANICIIKFEKERINSENHFTKCGWSPYDGMVMPGKVSHTVFKGRIVYESN